MRKILLLSALLASALLAKDVNIGVIMPLSGSTAAYGQAALEGIKLANEMKNKLPNGDTVKIVVLDTKGDKIESSNAAQRLISQDRAIGLIGEMLSANTLQIMSVAEESKVPLIAPAATGDKILNNKKYSSRVCFMDSFQGSSLAKYASDTLKYKSAVIVSDQSADYSLGLSRAFEKEFTAKGGKVLKKLRISSGDKDYKAVISQIEKLNPDFIYMPVYYTEAALFVRQARLAGLKTPMGSADGVADDTFIKLAEQAAENHIFTDSFDYTNPPTKLSKDFIAQYQKSKKTKEVPNFTAMGADAYFVMFEAMQKCASSLTSECVNNEIHKTTNFNGVSGIINIDKSGNATRSLVVKQIQNQKQVYKDSINP